jgi:hypothetical protein
MRYRLHTAICVLGFLSLIIAGCGQSTSQGVTAPTPGAGATPSAVVSPTPKATNTPATKATATPTRGGSNGYRAVAPGPGCDAGGGKWKTVSGGVVQCSANGLQLGNAKGSNFGAVEFDGLPSWGAFPTNYQVSIDATITDAAVGAGLQVRKSAKGGYSISISGSGTYSAYGGVILDTQTPSSSPPVNTTYHIVVKLVGSSITVTVNGAVKGNYSDSTFPSGTSLLLLSSTSDSSRTGYVTIKNFLITPLS